IVTLTAWYGLSHLARLRPGETVLIHSAAGGVGLMALAIARHLGGTVLATASPDKHDLLRSLGVTHIASSRDEGFAQMVLAATDGTGVDVILNSLPVEFMPLNLEALSQGGRFIEIGRRELWTAQQVAEVRPDAAYHIVDFDQVAADDPALLRAMLAEPLERLGEGKLPPPRTTRFDAERLPEAMAFMQTARHVGKIVLEAPAERAPHAPFKVDPEGTYLITGGLGGLGLHLAGVLADKGARHLVLAARSAPAPEVAAQIAALADGGATTVALDVCDADAVTALVRRLDAGPNPLRGVFHLAGGVDDGVVTSLGADTFRRVMAPKIAGAWNLHQATRGSALDAFVLYASLTGLLGAPGQANYAAANTFLDALALWRRAQGLPALAIDWGPWSEIGMAADTSARLGDAMLSPEAGKVVLERLLSRREPAVVIVPYGLADFLDGTPELRANSPYFADVREEVSRERAQSAEAAALREEILAATGSARAEKLAAYMEGLLAAVLRLDPSETIERSRPLQELGLDSLVGIQLRNRVRSDLSVELPIDALLADPTTESLVALVADLFGEAPAADAPVIARIADGDAPLSYAQRRMWFLAAMEPDSPFYSFTVAIALEGTLSRTAFDAALAAVVARHEALRTVFPLVEGEPVQRVTDGARVAVEFVDLAGQPPAAREAALAARTEAEARRTFDLSQGPLLAVCLVRLAPDHHHALVTMHHIVTDGWSQRIFAEEFAAFYRAHMANEAARLPPLAVRYRDFAAWQVGELAGERAAIGLDHWRKTLSAPLPDPPLPFDRPRAGKEVRRGATCVVEIEPTLADAAKALARAERTTLFTLLLTVFKTLLHRLTGDTDILVGTLAAGRVRPEVEGLIGFFANMVALRGDLHGDPRFVDLLAKEGGVVADA
ncbi:MAG: SDR family NAD(P)-dependent oxidoreductase, partial [Pseudomonadota bacterium]